ncbi:MAG: response regulator transcription factor [Chloroflexi bacterium]|nr:response regulator transcription factor [Chloroflexota bacterium]
MNPIKILLVDDHDVVRTGLRSFLGGQADVLVTAEARNGEEALLRAEELKPDLVIMDITMPGMDGLEATRKLKARQPECLALALTVHEDKQYFMEMLAAGASGYITKQAAADDLMAAIRSVAAGQVYLQPALARWLLEDYQRLAKQEETQAHTRPAENGEHAVGLDILSQREREVLELVGQGLNNQQIGKQLGLSPKTIARHRERIMNKLNMHSRTELVKFAIRTGLIAA